MPFSAENFNKRVFVTVGTTEFDELIEKITDNSILELLVRLGYSNLRLQIGRGRLEAINCKIDKNIPIKIDHYRFKNDIKEDLSSADLVISHAGAGTCLESLELKRPLLVVVNETLQDNHQFELAEQLFLDGHLVYCTPKNLPKVLTESKYLTAKPLPKGKPELFARFLDDYLNGL